MAKGQLILVTGYFGAGKSSLVQEAIKNIPNLTYLKTITNRKIRKGESSQEYIFVTKAHYNTLRKQSKNWDHTQIGSNYYGADATHYMQLLENGKNIVCCIAPDVNVIKQMRRLYETDPVIIWINTALPLANERLIASKNDARISRIKSQLQTTQNAKRVQKYIDHIFKPRNSIKEDQKRLTKLITRLIKS